ncbi:transmembrane protease serine 9-like [Clupea harengus]|uniref:Transmembrane protease serine 9-like n=1 Tax=Clupea harengus TaxID=7950 RepID=A0A8M1KFI9_CLUHA|nr:transmembrane protease serine 9-like [Clupea harengus]
MEVNTSASWSTYPLRTRPGTPSGPDDFRGTSTFGLVVYLGRQNQEGSNSNEVSRTVSRIIRHPNYNSRTGENDIALLRLSSSITFTNFIRPICLAAANSTFNRGTNSWLTGWGRIRSGVPLPSPQTLQEVDVPVTGNRNCFCQYNPRGVTITDNMICAGRDEGGPCQGDSGSPVVSKQGAQWVQSGVVSFGIGCALAQFPGVNARVSQYQSWINTQITSDQPGFVTFTSTGTDADLSATCTVCGQAPLNTRIVGGEDAPVGAWPWQASLHSSRGRHFCGGSLINKDWVMSAAHCFPSTSTFGPVVYLGRQNQEGSNSNEVSRTVSRIIRHPNYNSRTSDNDIALLQLSSSVTFTNFIRPICLAAANSTFNRGTNSWLTGWGRIRSGVPLPSPQTLQEVDVPVTGNRNCFCKYNPRGVTITDNMICAGRDEGGPCQGDSGSPVVSKQGTQWVQSGIVSFGIGCALAQFPGVNARVSQYQSWINTQITSDQPGFVTFTSTGTDADLSATCTGLPAVTTTTTPTTTTPATTPLPVVCGRAPLNSRLIGGSDVSAGVWPWLASLHLKGTHTCGGTLVSDTLVLTSANCFSSSSTPSDWTVFLGRLRQNGSNSNEESVGVANITLSSLSGENVAMVQLTRKPTLSNFIQPVCVEQKAGAIATGTTCWVTGWGNAQAGGEQPLQEVQTSVVACGNASSSADDICTNTLQLQQGDMGGPLMCKQGVSWFQASVIAVNSSSSLSTSNSRAASQSDRSSVQVFSQMSRFSTFLSNFSFPATFTSATSGGRHSYTPLSLLSLLFLSLSAAQLASQH